MASSNNDSTWKIATTVMSTITLISLGWGFATQSKKTQAELVQLRKQLMQAVNREAYEEAARLRDRIRQLEES